MPSAAPIVVGNLPPLYLQELNRRRAYLANITDMEFTRSRTYGNYTILGKKPHEEYSLLEIAPRRGTMDYGDKRVIDFPITPEEIAADLAREINADAGENSFLGVFVCGADGPTAQQLAEAHARLEAFYDRCIAAGDVEWERSEQIVMIPDLFKRAAKYRRQDREWAHGVKPSVECPGCGENLSPKVAVCKSCGCVVNRKRALELGMIQPEPEPAGEPATQTAAPPATKPKDKLKS